MLDNIYIELELFLDPPITNPAELRDELEKKLIPEWNKKINNSPKYKVFLYKAIKYKEDLVKLPLSNLADTAKKEKIGDLDHAIQEYERDGILEADEYKALCTKFNKCFKEETIKGRLHLKITPGFQAPAKPQSLNEEAMSIGEMESITTELSIIKNGTFQNLYDLLEVSRTSTAKSLLDAVKEENEKNRKVMQKTAEIDAKGRILGKALLIFKDETARKKYDNALKRQPFDELCRKTFDLRALGKTLSGGDYELSISDAQQQCGYSKEEAEWMVYDYYINQKKCAPPRSEVSLKATIQCTACFHLNDTAAQRCSHCGTPLKIKCPKCGKEADFKTGYCQCGFPLGDMANASVSIKNAKTALGENKIDDARAFVRKALLYWKDNQEALDLRKKIDEIERQESERKKKEQAEKEQKQKQAAVQESKIRSLIAKKCFFEAEKVIAELRISYPESALLQSEAKQAADILAEVRSDLAKLSNSKTTQEKIDICESVIEKVNDCDEATQALKQFPPLPPKDLQIKKLPASFQISWTVPSSRRIPHFIIVRKQGGIPVSPNDGEQIVKDLDAAAYTDSSCNIGVIYGYAVFSCRGEQVETIGCKSLLQQITDEVQNLQASPNNTSVMLTWTPLAAGTVRVIRSSEDAKNTEVFPQKPGHLHDTGLINGHLYTYKVQSVFKSPDGEEIITPGKTVSCKPVIPPPAVIDLKAEVQANNNVLLRWTHPPKGTLYLFVTKDTELPRENSILQADVDELIKRFGKPIKQNNDGTADWLNTEMSCLVIPVTYEDGLAVFGKSASVIKIEDVRHLRLHNSGTCWHLCWDWIAGIDNVLVVYRNDKTPEGKNDPDAVRKILSKRQYDKEEAFSLPAGRDYYFAVYTLFEKDNKIQASKGIRLQTLKTVIKYSLSLRQDANGEWEGLVQIEAENAETLPALIVRKMTERMPLNRNEGLVIASLSEVPCKQGSLLLTKKHFEEDSFIRLFVTEAEQAALYRIIDPPQKKAELYPR